MLKKLAVPVCFSLISLMTMSYASAETVVIHRHGGFHHHFHHHHDHGRKVVIIKHRR